MARLPSPGGDNNAWGGILNEYLAVEHNSDGTLKKAADIASAKAKADTAVQSVNGKTGTSVTLTASDVGALTSSIANGLYVGQGAQIVSVKDTAYGAVGNGSTDDTAAIQAAINAALAGSTVYFPPGTYAISSEIRLKAAVSYIGAGHALGSGAVIKQANGANITGPAGLTGLFVADAWYTNAAACDNPVRIHNLAFDGNKANNLTSNACGIVLCNFWSFVSDCYIANSRLHGIHLTDVTRNGTNVISNSASENRIISNRIADSNGHGISQISQNTISNQDGYCVDNIIATTGQDGINFQRGSGWAFRRNHLYGILGHGMNLTNCYATVVTDNEIETFGEAGGGGAFWGGIAVTQLNGRGTTVTGNFVGRNETAGTTDTYQHIVITAGSGQTTAQTIVTNNLILGPGASADTDRAIVLTGNVSGSVLHARTANNRLAGTLDTLSVISSPGVNIYEQDSRGREHVVLGAAATGTFNGAAQGTGSPGSTVTGNDFFGTFQFGTGTGATTGSVGGLNNFSSDFDPMIVALTPGNAATAALQPYVFSTFGTGLAIGVAVAPANSQPLGTYVIHYQIRG